MSRNNPPLENTLPVLFVPSLFDDVVRKNWRGAPYVNVPDLMAVKFRAFEIGSIIGIAVKGKLRVVARMLGPTNRFDEYADALLVEGQAEIEEVRSLASLDQLASLVDLFLLLEFQAKGFPSDALLRWKGRKVDLATAGQIACLGVLRGIGFGANFRDLASDLWTRTWESPPDGLWAQSRGHGLPLQPPPGPVTLEDRKSEITNAVKTVADVYFPDLCGYIGTILNEVSRTYSVAEGCFKVTLHDIEDWAVNLPHELLCPQCIERKLKDDRLFLVEGVVRDRRGWSVFKEGTEPSIQLYELDWLDHLEPLSRAWTQPHYWFRNRPLPKRDTPWSCDVCSRLIPMSEKLAPSSHVGLWEVGGF